MKKLNLLIGALSVCAIGLAQPFEGCITFKMYSKSDTTTNIYNVKGNAVKLDQLGKKSGKVEGAMVFDLAAKTVKLMNPSRKVWSDQRSEIPATVKGTPTVEKTANIKTLQGLKCTEYIVSDAAENTKISYWVYSPDKKGPKFDFFMPLVQILNRKDKASTYWKQIKDLPAGSMPLLSVETTMDGKHVGKLETIKVEKKTLDAASVSIPADYKKYEQ
jgi:hypothetical protein